VWALGWRQAPCELTGSAGRELVVEGALAVVNGYLGTRAAVEEGSSASTPATFLNGLFDAATQRQVIAAPTPELVVAPDWSRVRVAIDGAPFTLETAEILGQRRTLDLRRACWCRSGGCARAAGSSPGRAV
jgi:trehalose/maltose hydrolase-like predicted phosphorylase